MMRRQDYKNGTCDHLVGEIHLKMLKYTNKFGNKLHFPRRGGVFVSSA